MSKKKATMTLKDFHGGSIPSDLPLPSAPGEMVRPADRGGFDRQMSWGNSVGKSDHRLRPASAGSARNIDDKTPFLSHNAPIGRNFDEDERKPLDGVSGPRRTVSDDNIRAQPSRPVEPKMDNISGTRVGSRSASVQVSQFSSDSMDSSYTGRRNEVHNWGLSSQNFSGSGSAGMNYQNVGGNTGQPVAGSYPNAWGLRKESATVKEPVFAAWSAPDAASKLAHASALEKVSSGRWNSKEHVHSQKDVDILGHAETKADFLYKANDMYLKNNFNRIDVVDAADYHDIALAMHAGKSLNVGDVIDSGGKEVPPCERLKPTAQMESHERNPSVNTCGFQLLNAPGKSGGTEFHSSLPSEPSERPKLKLLPRSKPLENLESQVDYKQGLQQPSYVPVEDSHGVHETKYSAQPAFVGSVIVDRALERPKLSLKPRSQHIEQLEGKTEIERGTVFGGARPREVILKERRIDDAPKSNYDSQPPSRVKEVASKADMPIHISRYSEKGENVMVDQQKVVRYTDRRDHPVNGDRSDSQTKNRRNEIRKSNREVEKHRNQQQQQLQDRPPSPETWRKPVEHPKPASPDAPSLRYGKTASAAELAQAFSKSVSDQTRGDPFSGSKGLQRPGQVPFSRLMGPTPRPQINGY